MLAFLDLPPEIRLKVYAYSLNPNEYVKCYRKIATNPILGSAFTRTSNTRSLSPPLCDTPRPYVERHTPTILLLSKQITYEALPVLYRIPLTLHGTPQTYFVMRQMDIAEFISEHLLQKIEYAILRLITPEKFFVLSLLDIWGAGNRLRRLDVYLPEEAERNSRHWEIVGTRVI
ncbi:hypothetical protein N7478_004379 [Penicillium angulare]|uniref:uncharacterized protein n=1 Tax=Penicillium angulare TaxID=116970 RepID=UPI00254184A2|nr:uncharacterized protein N7478_004379 [Penicillium angulare]KAJ5279007.1 hypothetical protein N7478_004379 [Penicillium angulare]